MKKYLIYQTKAEAQNKINSINAEAINTIWTDGITNNYVNVTIGKDFFAVEFIDGYEEFFTSSELADLKTLTLDENDELIY